MTDQATPIDAGTARLLDKTLTLCRLAKDANLPVSQGRVIDAVRTLSHIDCLNEEDYRIALRANLVASKHDEVRFDRLFREFWHRVEDPDGDYKPWRPELIRGEKQYGELRGHEDMLSETEHVGAEEVSRQLDLTRRWDEAAPPLDQVIRDLAKRLATRPSRRVRVAQDGKRIDLRRSVRRNVRHGMDMLDLAKVKKQTRKTRIVLLADVSGSMDAFNPFLLQLMLGLQKALSHSRTFVFSTKVTEVTTMLRRNSVRETLKDVSRTVNHWSGGTDIGGALANLNRGALREGSSRSTVLVVISDGYDSGTVEKITLEMRNARRRAKTIVWINPMYGASTFQVRAAGMKAALPFVDHFLPAFNAESLKTLVRELARI